MAAGEGALRRRALIGLAATGVAALAPSAAQAAPFEVTDLNDGPAAPCMPGDCSLRDAVIDAAATAEHDTITFQSGLSGTLRLTQGQIATNEAFGIDIVGPGAGTIAISGDANNSGTHDAGDTRIFSFAGSAGQTSISGLTLTGGYATGEGGAISATGGHTLTLDDDIIEGNKATANGGGVATSTPATVTDTVVSGNEAVQGGGFYASKALSLGGTTVSGNTASGAGGGVRSATTDPKYAPDLTIRDSRISGNDAQLGGGVSHLGNDLGVVHTPATVVLERSTFDGNHATAGDGGGVEVGPVNEGDDFTLTHSTFSRNTASGLGGGLAVDHTVFGSFDLVDSTVSGNSAARGGGVSFPAPGDAYASGGTLGIESSTVAANHADTKGGGFYLGYIGLPDHDSSTVTLSNTVVADNTGPSGPDDLGMADDAASGGFALAFSLVESPGAAKLPGSTSSRTGVDPQLGPLGSNGGPTETMLPAASSPLVDKGKAPSGLSTDQRGEPRTNQRPPANAGDGTDIGAVELPTQAFETTITQAPKAKVKSKKSKVKVTIAFTSDAEGATFQCAVDGTSFSSCTSPLTLTLKAKKKKGKRHTILVRAVGDGTVDATPAQVTFKAVQKSKKKKKKKKKH